MMSGFWQAFEQASGADVAQWNDRQTALWRADQIADDFVRAIQKDAQLLEGRGLRLVKRDRTVSFRQGGLELVAINFGTVNGHEIRISSPVIEYLRLSPSVEDMAIDGDVEEAAGRWLGHSIDVVERNRPVFTDLGYV